MANSNCISVTQNLKKEFVNSFFEYLSNPGDNNWFLAIGNPIPWSFDKELSQNGIIYTGTYQGDDSTIPSVPDTDKEKLNFHRTCIALKRIEPKDVSFLIEKIPWTQNTVYSPYRHDEEMFLPNKKFYAYVEDTKRVYKCIENNDYGISAGATYSGSQIEPYSTNTEIIDTNDGYKWKFMYQLNTGDELLFSIDGRNEADSFIPVKYIDFNPTFSGQIDGYELQKTVQDNAVNGSISSIYINEIYKKKYKFNPNYCALGDNSVYLKNNASVGATSVTIDYFGNNSISNSLENMAFYVVGGTGSGQIRKIKSSYRSANGLVLGINPLKEGLISYVDGNSNESVVNIIPYIDIIGDGEANNTSIAKDDNLTSALALPYFDEEGYMRGVDLLDIGKNYTYASSRINKGLLLDTGTTGPAFSSISVPSDYLKTSMSPQGGHGSNAVTELGASKIVLKVSLEGTENGRLSAVNDFRQIAIIKNPKFSTKTAKLRTSGSVSGITAGQEVSLGTGVTGTVLRISSYTSGGNEIVVSNIQGTMENIASIGGQSIRSTDGLEFLTNLGSENKNNLILKSTSSVSDISGSVVVGVGNSDLGLEPSYASGKVEKIENTNQVFLDTVRGSFKENEKVLVLNPTSNWATGASFVVEEISNYNSNSFQSSYRTTTTLVVKSQGNQLFDGSSFTPDHIIYCFEDNTQTQITTNTEFKSNAFVFNWKPNITSVTTEGGLKYNTGTLEIVGARSGAFKVGDYLLYYKNGIVSYALINTVTEPEVLYGSGEILYVQNFTGIERYQGSSEEINLVLGL